MHSISNFIYSKLEHKIFHRKKMSSTPVGASTIDQHYGWGTRQSQGTFDQWPISFVPGTYTKNIFPQRISLACESLLANMTVCHLPALWFHPVPLKLSNPDQTTSV